MHAWGFFVVSPFFYFYIWNYSWWDVKKIKKQTENSEASASEIMISLVWNKTHISFFQYFSQGYLVCIQGWGCLLCGKEIFWEGKGISWNRIHTSKVSLYIFLKLNFWFWVNFRFTCSHRDSIVRSHVLCPQLPPMVLLGS